MNIHEYQAKSLLRDFGVAVPEGQVAFTVDEAVEAAKNMGGPVWVVKAQIHAGGRGKGGGVKVVKSYWTYVQREVQARFEANLSARDAAHDIVLNAEYAKQPFADWNSPERMMTNVHTMYRHLQGRADHPKVPELVNIMRKQALLAHTLPDAQPAVTRRR